MELSHSNPIVGIDLGTTHSLVAFVRNGQPEILNSRDGSHLLPSVVSLVDGEPVVGAVAKRHKVRDAAHTVFSVKRLLGRNYEDLRKVAESLPYEILPGEGAVRIQIGDRVFTAIEISAMILRELKFSAEKALGTPVTRAVITVPAYFNDSQRQATRMAGRLAGLDVLRIINEPTAASLAYGLDRKKQGLIAVYDLGGGTFDVSILKLHDGVFEVLATNGDTALGGDDLDRVIVDHAAAEILKNFNLDAAKDIQLLASLLETAEKVKINLSTDGEAEFKIQLAGGKTYRHLWTLSEFELLVKPVLDRTRQPCLQAIEDAGLKLENLSDVVMVGGPTRLKIVQDIARDIFGRTPNTSVHPDEVVAAGAAIQADILAGRNKDFLLLDVVPLSLGLETYGGLMTTLISRNTRIPTVAREPFTTFVDNQTGVEVHVLQGERDRAEDNRSLARFKLRVQPQPAGIPRVEVSFLIDADGILQVAARDMKTGNESAIEVKPSYGLTDSEVEQMLVASMDHAQGDIDHRKWVEARNEAEIILRAGEKQLSDAHRLLSKTDAQKIEQNIIRLKDALSGSNLNEIQESVKAVNSSTTDLAGMLIKETLKSATGNSVKK